MNRYVQDHPDTTIDFAAYLGSHVPRNQEIKIRMLEVIEERFRKRESLIRTRLKRAVGRDRGRA